MIVTGLSALCLGVAVACFLMALITRRDFGASICWAIACTVFGVLGAFIGFGVFG